MKIIEQIEQKEPEVYVNRKWIARQYEDIKNPDLTKWIRAGKLKALKVGSRYLYLYQDIQAMYQDRRERKKTKKEKDQLKLFK